MSVAKALANAYVVAWCDLTGRSEWFDPNGDIKPSFAEVPGEKWIWRADRIGDRLCRYTQAEFPEKWELEAIQEAPREILEVPELPADLATTVVIRANEVLAELQRELSGR